MYYFISINGSFVDPAMVDAPSESVLKSRVLARVPNIALYSGTLKRRYRFHYDLFIEDYVYQENLTDFGAALQIEWNNNISGSSRSFLQTPFMSAAKVAIIKELKDLCIICLSSQSSGLYIHQALQTTHVSHFCYNTLAHVQSFAFRMFSFKSLHEMIL